MTIDQFNEFINKGQAASALLVIAFLMLLIYHKVSRRQTLKK